MSPVKKGAALYYDPTEAMPEGYAAALAQYMAGKGQTFPSPTGTTGGETPMAMGGTPRAVGAEYGPYTQYLMRLGLGGGGYMTPAQRYQASLYDPLQALYGLEQRFVGAPGMGAAPGEWGDYIGRGYAYNPAEMYGRAGGMLGGLMGMSPAQREEYGMTWGVGYPELGAGEPERLGLSMAEQQALVGMALRPSWGPYGAQRMAGRLPQEEQLWMQQQAQGEVISFLDYLRRKYNMGRYV